MARCEEALPLRSSIDSRGAPPRRSRPRAGLALTVPSGPTRYSSNIVAKYTDSRGSAVASRCAKYTSEAASLSGSILASSSIARTCTTRRNSSSCLRHCSISASRRSAYRICGACRSRARLTPRRSSSAGYERQGVAVVEDVGREHLGRKCSPTLTIEPPGADRDEQHGPKHEDVARPQRAGRTTDTHGS